MQAEQLETNLERRDLHDLGMWSISAYMNKKERMVVDMVKEDMQEVGVTEEDTDQRGTETEDLLWTISCQLAPACSPHITLS